MRFCRRLLVLGCVGVVCLSACTGVTDEETSEESSNNEMSDVILPELSEVDESSLIAKLHRQQEDILAMNTAYSQRYKDFLTTLLEGDYSISYSYITNSMTDITMYDVVKSGDDWYYKVSINDQVYEYFEKAGVGHYYDDTNRVLVTIVDTVKTLEDDCIPARRGVKFVEKGEGTFEGVSYSTDKYDIYSSQYTEDMQDLEAFVLGTMVVYYDKTDNVVAMDIEYPREGYSQHMTVGEIQKGDTGVFELKKGYTEISLEKYLEKYGDT